MCFTTLRVMKRHIGKGIRSHPPAPAWPWNLIPFYAGFALEMDFSSSFLCWADSFSCIHIESHDILQITGSTDPTPPQAFYHSANWLGLSFFPQHPPTVITSASRAAVIIIPFKKISLQHHQNLVLKTGFPDSLGHFLQFQTLKVSLSC